MEDALQYTWHESNEKRQEDARQAGLVVIHPLPNEVLLDLDSEAAVAVFHKNFAMLNRHLALERPPLMFTSKSGPPKMHAYVALTRPLNDFERIALQGALGSDATREMCGWLRQTFCISNPTLLFETPDNASAVEAWRQQPGWRSVTPL